MFVHTRFFDVTFRKPVHWEVQTHSPGCPLVFHISKFEGINFLKIPRCIRVDFSEQPTGFWNHLSSYQIKMDIFPSIHSPLKSSTTIPVNDTMSMTKIGINWEFFVGYWYHNRKWAVEKIVRLQYQHYKNTKYRGNKIRLGLLL